MRKKRREEREVVFNRKKIEMCISLDKKEECLSEIHV